MKKVLNYLFEHKTLTREEAKEVLVNITNSKYNESEISAFLTVYLMRSITTDELMGFRDALLDLCLKVDLGEFDTIDLCGTGGDNKNTFNISTTASFVVAGAGYKVAKHGNYGVSSVSGSSNLLEYFGYKFSNDISRIKREIDDCNICFLHAPLFHPAMKNVAPVRRQLGVKTFFNMLGPMVNPSFPKYQMVGVFSLELARLYNYIYQQTEKGYVIIHSLDGYDEISLTGDFKVLTKDSENIYSPEYFSLGKLKDTELTGGNSVAESAKIFTEIINGGGTVAQRNVVIANAAFAIKTMEKEKSLFECINIAEESISSGKALNIFKKLINY
jgi:anthranilate phosphoribosyltransferase